MSKKFVYLPNSFDTVTTHEVGAYTLELNSLLKLKIPVLKSAVIPQDTLKLIGQTNNLQTKVYKLIQETDYSSSFSKNRAKKQLSRLITTQRIPKELASTLLKTYHDYFKKSFILIKNAEPLSFNDIYTKNIHSDTNFVVAILETWAKISVAKLEKLMSRTHSTHDILFPTPLLILEQLESEISGVGYTFDLSDGNKNRVTIKSSFGVYTNTQQDCDQYLVDIRTYNLVNKQIKTKNQQFRRVLGKLRVDEVLVKNKNQETLNQKQLKQLTQIISTIKKKYLSQLKIYWGIKNNDIFIEHIEQTDISFEKLTLHPKTLKKLYSTVNTSFSLKKIEDSIDGIAVYNSGNLLSVSTTHPQEVVKTKQKKYLVKAISKTLEKYIQKTNKPLLYRANNFTSKEFNKLSFASMYEVSEANPQLGFRGGIRFLSQQEAFKLELEIILNTLQETKKEISFVLPFIRSPEELAQILQLIKKYGLTNFSNFSIWLELSTPENILNLKNYQTKNLKGVIFNTQSIHELITGIDNSNPDVASHYSKNDPLLKQLLKTTINTIAYNSKTNSLDKKPHILVDLTTYNQDLLQSFCDLEIDGFIVNEEVTESAKKCIIDIEKNKII